MFNFLHNFRPTPVLLSIGPVAIHWYGLLVVLGIIAGIAVAIWLAKKYGIKPDTIIDLAFWAIIFGLLGGRLYAVLLFADYYFLHPLEIFAVWRGGLAIHGAIIAGVITLFIFAKKYSKQRSVSQNHPVGRDSFPTQLWLLADIVVVAVALGQAIGRWGNYFNQELFGKPTNLPWGIPIDFVARPPDYLNYEFFHPTFLYESILNLLIFGILIVLHSRRIKKLSIVSCQLSNVKCGAIALLYLIFYSLTRIAMEFLRIDQTPLVLGIRLPIVVSVIIIIITSILLFKINSLSFTRGKERDRERMGKNNNS